MGRPKKAAVAEAPNETPPADEPPAIAKVAASTIDHIPLGRLVRAPENVRHLAADAAVDELADDIAGHGLLQSLIGYADDGEGTVTTSAGPLTFIVGGGRRLQALERLRERGAIGFDYLVPVQLRPREQAIELSLAENLARKDMSPVDEFRAFKALMDLNPGTIGTAQLAARFGYTEKHVKQRMRLADLHPDILDALAEGAFGLDAAYAYATTQDLDVQLRVFKAQWKSNWRPHDPDTVRREIRGDTFDETHRLVRFVGIEAYEAAGGRYEDSLFAAFETPIGDGQAAPPRRLIDTPLIRALAKEKAAAPCEALAQQAGYISVLPSLERDQYGHAQTPKAPKGTAALRTDWSFQQSELTKAVNKALKKGIPVTGVAELDAQGELTLLASIVFVPKDKVTEIKPKQRDGGYREPTPEEREAAARERFVAIWSPRLAVPRFAGTHFEGRVFWPQNQHWAPDLRDYPGLGRGYKVSVEIFVSEADRDAQLEAAGSRYDEEKAARAAAAAEVEAERTAREAAALAQREQLLADPPAMVRIDEEPFDFFRWPDGSYPDVRPPEGTDEAETSPEDAGAEMGFETLEELLDHAQAIGSPVRSWPTLAAYDNDGTIGTTPGMCRVCECTEDRACTLEDSPCSWADDTRTLCSNPECLAVAARAAERDTAPAAEESATA